MASRRRNPLVVAGLCLTSALGVCRAVAAQTFEGAARRGPWSAYVSAGVPKLESNDFAVDGDLRLGYVQPRLGAWARGRVATYDLTREGPHREQTNIVSEAEGQAWGNPLHERNLAVSLGVDAGFFQYSSDSSVAAPIATSIEDASQVVRLGAVAAVKTVPGPELELDAALLGGGQREAYLQTTLQATGNLQDVDERRYSAWGAAQVSAVWRFVPDVVSAGLRTGAHFTRLERARVFLGFNPSAGITQSNRHVSATRIDWIGRGELGFDVAKVLGVLPFLYAELEWIRESSSDASSVTTVPSGGLGLKTEGL